MALHELTIKAIRRAQKQGGIIDPIGDWDAIAALDALARATDEIAGESKLLFLNLPVTVGNAELRRLSWGAMDWMTECAGPWFADDNGMYDRALAWAHANAGNPGAFRRHTERREAVATIKRWSRGLSAPWVSIMAAVDQLLSGLVQESSSGSKKESVSSDASLFESLLHEYGKPPEYWLWEISAEAFAMIIKARVLRISRMAEESDRAAGNAPDPEGRYAKSAIKFQRAARIFVEAIVARSKS